MTHFLHQSCPKHATQYNKSHTTITCRFANQGAAVPVAVRLINAEFGGYAKAGVREALGLEWNPIPLRARKKRDATRGIYLPIFV